MSRGSSAAVALLADLAWPEALLLAVILAPTDAALGQAVVTLPGLPSRIRQGLNVESGLNDGICVPIFFIALGIAEAEAGTIGDGAAARLVAEQIGYGILAGAIAGAIAAAVVLVAERHANVDAAWLQIGPLAGAALAYGIASPIGGSGFIAAFVGGMVFGGLLRGRADHVGDLLEERGRRARRGHVRRLRRRAARPRPRERHGRDRRLRPAQPHARAHAPGRGLAPRHGRPGPTVGFLGWFGPRGLASIVFAVMLDEGSDLPHEETLLVTVFVTVAFSVLLHGLTAAPLAERYAGWFAAHPRDRVAAEAGRRRRCPGGTHPAPGAPADA